MAKAKTDLLKMLGDDGKMPNIQDILVQNRLASKPEAVESQVKGDAEVTGPSVEVGEGKSGETPTEPAIAVQPPAVQQSQEEAEAQGQKVNVVVQEKAAAVQQKGEANNDEKKTRRTKSADTKGKPMDWNNLDSFTVKDNVPTYQYGMKSQRLTDQNHAAFELLASRAKIPSVHLMNHVLACFIERFREELNEKFPAQTI